METRTTFQGEPATPNATSATTGAIGTMAGRAHSALDSTVEKVAPTVNRMLDKAHQTIDRVADSATPAADNLQHVVRSASDRTTQLAEQWAATTFARGPWPRLGWRWRSACRGRASQLNRVVGGPTTLARRKTLSRVHPPSSPCALHSAFPAMRPVCAHSVNKPYWPTYSYLGGAGHRITGPSGSLSGGTNAVTVCPVAPSDRM